MAMPRIIIAVLKFSEATITTIGMTSSITLIRAVNFPICSSSYNGQVKFQDSAYYLKKQLFADILGIAVMAFVAQIDYRVWKNFWFLAYAGA